MSPPDQARLAQILKIARQLELVWPQADRQHKERLAESVQYQDLKREIASCAHAEADSLRRLAASAAHLHDEISLAHFYTCLVPFERLSARALRDDEFLVDEGDRPQKAAEPVPLKLIVENLRSAFNVGALFRTAECLGVSEIALSGYTPGPDDEKTARTSMGTSGLVRWRRVDRGRTACEAFRQEGYKIVALETAADAVLLTDMDFSREPVAFALGNERFGLEADTLQAVDAICRIPLRGMKNSLNVGIAFGIAGFEWLRRYEAHK